MAGFALYAMKKKYKRIGVLLITPILVTTWVVSMLGVYHSPWNFQESWQVTYQDVAGANWFFTYRNTKPTFGLGYFMYSFTPPPHFGYSHYNTLGEYFVKNVGSNGYTILTQRFKLANDNPILSKYKVSPQMVGEFSEDDFKRLEVDPTVNKIYINKEFNIFLVRHSV